MKIIQRLFELQVLEMGPTAEAPETRRSAETIRKEIPEPILAHYDRLLVRGKKGVALVRRGVCTGCQMRMASGTYASLLRDEDIAMCDTCGRYLLLAPEDPAPPVTPPPPQPKPAPEKPARKKPRRKDATDSAA